MAYGDARIVVTSSVGYQFSAGIDYASLTTTRPGDGTSLWDVKAAFVRYGNSKLANIYFANELDRRLREDGYKNIYCNSCHPGELYRLSELDTRASLIDHCIRHCGGYRPRPWWLQSLGRYMGRKSCSLPHETT